MHTMFKSFLFILTLGCALILSMIPALTFHYVMYCLEPVPWTPRFNLIVIGLMVAGVYFVNKPDSLVSRILAYFDN